MVIKVKNSTIDVTYYVRKGGKVMDSSENITRKLREQRIMKVEKKLQEASFEKGGHKYVSAFGKYSMDGKEITRDEYFKAKGSTNSSAKSNVSNTKITPSNKKSKFKSSDFIETRGIYTEVNRDKFVDYLNNNDYELVRATYKDANHNRQGYQYVFTNGKDYITMYRAGGNPDGPEHIKQSNEMPDELKYKYPSYTSAEHLSLEDASRCLGYDRKIKVSKNYKS